MTGNSTEWVLTAHLLNPILAADVRIVIRDINNGRWYGDKNPLPIDPAGHTAQASPLRATLYELEAWGSN